MIRGEFTLPDTWTVFGFLECNEMDLGKTEVDVEKMAQVPDFLACEDGVYESQTIRRDAESGCLDPGAILGDVARAKVAYLFGTIVSERDQVATFGIGADWWVQVWVNGKKTFDTTRQGNGAWPPTYIDHRFDAVLSKGDNLVAIRLLSGSISCTVSVGSPGEIKIAERQARYWPLRPVVVSPREAVIERFFSGTSPGQRWHAVNGEFSSDWAHSYVSFQAEEAGQHASISRQYDAIDLSGYKRLRLRLRPGEGVATSVTARIDGEEKMIVPDSPGKLTHYEIVGPITGKTLERVTVRLKATMPGEKKVQLQWMILENDEAAWQAPAAPFDGMVVSGEVGRPEPGLGLLFDSEQMEIIRSRMDRPNYEEIRQQMRQAAEREVSRNPAEIIRPYYLHAPCFGRDADQKIVGQEHLLQEGLALAMWGMLTKDEESMQIAAKYAVAVAHIDHWLSGFISHIDGAAWQHAAFAPNRATIHASLLLDWTWNYLTPKGRELIREAIREKGLAKIEPRKGAILNQAIRFSRGMLLGKMATEDQWSRPEVKAYLQDCLGRLDWNMARAIRPDGSFSEGRLYGQETVAIALLSYVVASRGLGRPLREVVSERISKAIDFLLEINTELTPDIAAFAAGPLGRVAFDGLCVPTDPLKGSLDYTFGMSISSVESMQFLLPVLWADVTRSIPESVKLPPFSVYRDGGWVFARSKGAEANDEATTSLSFESGLWDGYGHAWMRKNSIALDGWGEPLLFRRFHLAYNDARCVYTMHTKLYNTFTPNDRTQDAVTPEHNAVSGRGGELRVAEDMGDVVVIVSHNSTAWLEGVESSYRRLLFIRPNIVLVEDRMRLSEPQTGVQNWNSLSPWEMNTKVREFLSRGKRARVRVRQLLPETSEMLAREDSVTRAVRGEEAPVYRATFTLSKSFQHQILTAIQVLGPDADERQDHVKQVGDGEYEIRQKEMLTRLFVGEAGRVAALKYGFGTDAEILFLVCNPGGKDKQGDIHGDIGRERIRSAGGFGCTYIESASGKTASDGSKKAEFLRISF